MSRRMTKTAFVNPAARASSKAKSSIVLFSGPNFAACFRPPKRLPMPAAIAIIDLFIRVFCG